MKRKQDFEAINQMMGKKKTNIPGASGQMDKKPINTKGMQKSAKTGTLKRGM